MKLAVACDHRGFRMKTQLLPVLEGLVDSVMDLGVSSDATRADFPDLAEAVAGRIAGGLADRGLLICGSGVGVTIAANKFAGVYACLCHDPYSAAQGVEHDNMNVLCLGGMIIGEALAESLVRSFLAARFDAGTARYRARFDRVRRIEAARGGAPAS